MAALEVMIDALNTCGRRTVDETNLKSLTSAR